VAATEAFSLLSGGYLRALVDLALKSIERAALAQHPTVGAHLAAAARKELWP
jgi:hypothetical protein